MQSIALIRSLRGAVGVLLFRLCFFAGLAGFVLVTVPSLRAAEEAKVKFDVPAGDASKALKTFARQAQREIMFPLKPLGGVKTNVVEGEYSVKEGLEKLLAGTELSAFVDEKTGGLVVQRQDDPNAPRLAQKNSGQPTSEKSEMKDGVLRLETFEVMGSKLLNMDRPRSRDDVQPYVIFNRAAIAQSGANDVEDFLKTRLTMDTAGLTANQGQSNVGNISTINLRGLGANQTLILIDGHRATNLVVLGSNFQSDLNAIPLAAIERIEVLPTTASAIYGGSATGGAVNIILRRDYAGAQLKMTYENAFQSDVGRRTVDLSAGFTLEQGRTNVLFTGHIADAGQLLTRDRNFYAQGIALILANNPGFIYGSTTPPLGATANIRSSDGSNLTLKSGAALNSPFTFVPTGYAGASADGGAALVANAGKYNLLLAPSAQANGGGRLGLLNAPKIESGMITIRRHFGPKVDAFLETSLSRNAGHILVSSLLTSTFTVAATAPNNPFTQALRVTVPTSAVDGIIKATNYDQRVVGGVIVKLPADWTAEADLTWSRSRFSYDGPLSISGGQTAAIQNGVLDVLRDTTANPLDFSTFIGPPKRSSLFRSTLKDASLRLAGPVLTLPAGRVNVSALAETREQEVGDGTNFTSPTNFVYFPPRSQSIDSVYLETKVPLVAPSQQIKAVQSLELQIAARHDEYNTKGVTSSVQVGSTTPVLQASNHVRSTDPLVGVKYQPVQDIAVRASYGTGFLPPDPNQLVPSGTAFAPVTVTDPKRGNAIVSVPVSANGGNPNLRPEESQSWSAGVILTPRVLAGLRLSVDYTRIEKRDNITLLSGQQLIDNEAFLPSRVVRAAPVAGDPFSVGAITSVDLSRINLSRALVEAYDVALDYSRTTSLGEVGLFAAATWQTHFKTQVVPTAAFVEFAGMTSNFPLKFKANAGGTWRYRGWSVGWTARYFDSYVVSTSAAVIALQGAMRVPSQTYHDLQVGYAFPPQEAGPQARRLSGIELQAGLKNVFNHQPPIDENNSPLYYSAFADPRISTWYFSLKKAF